MSVLENIKQNPKRYIKSLVMDLVVVIVSVAYVFYNMITLQFQILNPLVLLAQGIVSIICGVAIKQSLGENGFSKGYNSTTWAIEESLYNEACNTATPYMERVDNFYLTEEMEKRKKYRREHLQAVRLKYSMWFDDNGNYIATDEMFKKLDRKQRRMVRQCVKVKIYVLNLFSEYATASEQDTKKEITDKAQRAKNITRNTISATVIAMVGVYFLPILTLDWASFIASTMQVSLWVLFGITQLYKNYSFVVQDKVALLKKKKELIKKFTKGCEQGMYLDDPYEIMERREQHVSALLN